MIVDLVEDGGDIVVDFDYPGHHADRVPMSSCVAIAQTKISQYQAGLQAQVLLQHRPDQPWRWYPDSRILFVVHDGVYKSQDGAIPALHALVEVPIDGEIIRLFTECGKVKLAMDWVPLTDRFQNNAGREVFCDQFPKDLRFAKYCITLPSHPAVLEVLREQGFRGKWNRLTKSILVRADVVQEHLRCKPKFTYVSTTELQMDKPEFERLFAYAESGQTSARKKTRNGDSVVVDALTPFQDMLGLSRLPPELISEILSYCDAITWVMCRQVDRSWDAILSNRHYSVVTIRTSSRVSRPKIRLALLVYHTVTVSTRCLVISARDNFSVRLVTDMLAALQIKVPLIVLARMTVGWGDLLMDALLVSALIREGNPVVDWCRVCAKLELRNVDVIMPPMGVLDMAKCTMLTYLQKHHQMQGIRLQKKEYVCLSVAKSVMDTALISGAAEAGVQVI
ncbi:uncharacterized protein LOC129595414 [Paramacrobiotus metropolitanus]|uniref:uncharacterized protein LOC129595414 n=1 Tax=Paramacrobiotus metropolitanus TaxID=2943436 RepID=UPI002445CC3D|nr:uncharacterized protein LOC129595414 [Paramacrobiotus metropolitanus]